MQSALKMCQRCRQEKYPHDFGTGMKVCKCCHYAARKPTELDILRKNDMLGCTNWGYK